MQVKYCSKCKTEKPLEQYSPSKTSKQGVHAYCRPCQSKISTEWHHRNKERISLRRKERRIKDGETVLAVERAYRARNVDKVKEYSKWHYQVNKDKRLDQTASWYQKNKAKKQQKARVRTKERLKTDINFKLAARLRNALYRAVVGGAVKKDPSVSYLGIDVADFKAHLESRFLPGMSWDNYGKDGWHIDHIRPLASFDLTDEAQLREACHYTNLQPLWAKDNLRKGARHA